MIQHHDVTKPLSRHEESTQHRQNNEVRELSYHRKLTFGVADVHGASLSLGLGCNPACQVPATITIRAQSKHRRPLCHAVLHAHDAARLSYRSGHVAETFTVFVNVTLHPRTFELNPPPLASLEAPRRATASSLWWQLTAPSRLPLHQRCSPPTGTAGLALALSGFRTVRRVRAQLAVPASAPVPGAPK